MEVDTQTTAAADSEFALPSHLPTIMLSYVLQNNFFGGGGGGGGGGESINRLYCFGLL